MPKALPHLFEVIAKDQGKAEKFYSDVFGWQYQSGSAGFAYVHFPRQVRALLGGIGQAVKDPSGQWEPGLAPGHSFYLLVDDIEAAMARVQPADALTSPGLLQFASICLT